MKEIHIHPGTTVHSLLIDKHNLILENEKLRLENWQLKGALGYEVPGHIPPGDFKCGLCDARNNTRRDDMTTVDDIELILLRSLIERKETCREAADLIVRHLYSVAAPDVPERPKINPVQDARAQA